MARGFLTILGILAHFANPFSNQVFASITQESEPKFSLASIKEEVQPNNQRCTLWPGAAVIYQTHPDIGCPTSNKCKVLMDAIEHYEAYTCIRFKERSQETDYVNIIETSDKPGCSTLTGRIGGAQTLELGTHCWHKALIMHELGHIVGLPDEISRPDRDEYVEINFDNISPDNYYTFRKEYPAFPSVLERPFDQYSIMMDGPYASAMSSRIPTIAPKNNRDPLTSRWDKLVLSYEDKQKITTLYRCKGKDQSPDFPFDVKCSFGEGTCGFKNLDDSKWNRRAASRRKDGRLDSYFRLDFEKDNPAPARLASVNFHGLSPLDKIRGSNGCVSFSYYISSDKSATLQLLQMQLGSPHQLEYGNDPKPLWSKSAYRVGWTPVSIPVRVTKPFALVFQADYVTETFDGFMGLGDFELSYYPCTKPTDLPRLSFSLCPHLPAWPLFFLHRSKSSQKEETPGATSLKH